MSTVIVFIKIWNIVASVHQPLESIPRNIHYTNRASCASHIRKNTHKVCQSVVRQVNQCVMLCIRTGQHRWRQRIVFCMQGYILTLSKTWIPCTKHEFWNVIWWNINEVCVCHPMQALHGVEKISSKVYGVQERQLTKEGRLIKFIAFKW